MIHQVRNYLLPESSVTITKKQLVFTVDDFNDYLLQKLIVLQIS